MNEPERYRPRLHFSAQRNWINDPNGLIWHDGEYHLFYQYNPFGDVWGHMSWGHAVSSDLLHWQELPVAIAEDERVSIYSGSAVHDGQRLVAIYTGCLRREEGGQAQELAFSSDRGRSFVKHPGNPVLDLGLRDFRDPKVFWHAASARWVMVVVVPDARQAKFYASTDLQHWQWLSDFGAPFDGEGIWECPDLIELPDPAGGTSWLFKVDVFGGHPSGGTGARIFLGRFDGTRFEPEPQDAPRWADGGADFYAALSWADLPGAPARAVWIAWMSCHRYGALLPTAPWRGAMTLPRELSLRRPAGGGWQLLQRPLPALQSLWSDESRPADVVLDDAEQALAPGADLRCADIELTLELHGASSAGLVVHAGPGEGTRVGVDAARGVLFVDRAGSGWLPAGDALYVQRHEAALPTTPGPLRLRVLVDRCSVEVFADDGAAVITDLSFPGPMATGLRLFAQDGGARFTQLVLRSGPRELRT